MLKNIIYITGNNSFAVSEEVKRWRNQFATKYGEDNIEPLSIEKKDFLSELNAKVLITGLFSSKRLFLVRGGTSSRSKKGGSGTEEILEKVKDIIPEDHFLLFYELSEKEEGLTSWLLKNADVKKFDTLWKREYWIGRFDMIEEGIVKNVVKTYETAFGTEISESHRAHLGHKISQTLELISLDKDPGAYERFIHEGVLISDFDLSNAFHERNTEKILRIIEEEFIKKDSQKVLTGLISQIKNTVYIKYLSESGKTAPEIADTIQVHPFVLKKILASPLSYRDISAFYGKLIQIDRAYKSGKGIKDTELGRKLSIERAIFGLKK